MEPHQQQYQQQTPPPLPWYGPSPPYHHIPPPHQHQPFSFQPYPHHTAPPPQQPPHSLPIPPWPPAAPDYTPAGPDYAPPPPPGSSLYHHNPPLYPSHPPRYPYPTPPPVPPPPGQVWGNSPWNQQQDRSLSYQNEGDLAARARAWAEANSVTDSHSSVSFTSAGRSEIQQHFPADPLQKTIGHLKETQQPSLPGNHYLPNSTTDYQKHTSSLQESSQINLDSSSYLADPRASYNTRSESLLLEKVNGAPPQVNFSSNSSFFEQEVPSSYSSISGREHGNQYERPQMPLPPLVCSSEDGGRTSHSALPFQPTPMDQPHAAYPHQFPSSTDASDQPLVFEQRYTFDLGQNEKMSYRDANVTGALGMEHVEAAPPVHAWTPSAAFSQASSVMPAQQFDSSYGSRPMASGDHPLVFGRITGPSFHPNVPAVAQFGLDSVASLHPSAAFTEEAIGAFGHTDRPKKPSVPNWLREELIKKKASIATSALEQTASGAHSISADDEDRPSGNSDHADRKSNDSTTSVEDDEDDADAARTAAINQEIKRILTDILLKVTDELFEEIAVKVINEDELTVEVDNSITVTKVLSPATMTPNTAARFVGSVQGKSTKTADVISPGSLSIQGSLLGLANYDSDDDEDERARSGLTPSDSVVDQSYRIRDSGSLDNASKAADKRVDKEKLMPLSENSNKKASSNAALHVKKSSHEDHHIADASRTRFISTGNADDIRSEHSGGSERKESMGDKPSGKVELVGRRTAGLSTSNEAKGSGGKYQIDSRHPSHSANNDANDMLSERYNEDTVASGHRRGGSGERVKEKLDKQDNLRKMTKGHETRKRDSEELDLDDGRGPEKDKRSKAKDDGGRKREQAKNTKVERHERGERDSNGSKSRYSPSPTSRPMISKDSSIASHGVTSSGEAPDDSKKRRSHSNKHSLSRSPPRSKHRQSSRSPHSKHSHRRHSPNSYMEKRRRSRSASPVHRRR